MEEPDRIGGTTKHHVNYSASGAVTDDASAQRTKADYNIALSYLKAQDYDNAAKTAGTMTHYIVDLAIFGHVMGHLRLGELKHTIAITRTTY
jgi:hypothetical protein